MEQGTSALNMLKGKPTGKRLLGGPTRIYENNSRMVLKNSCQYEELGWFGLG
jgi:hypothetical protein